ncbi:hypothetical protein [Paenibacillus nasutitermitis]|uniref:hypothetical protein n=1 Tax=Paenibacillus nasutitermitis TaxID=1652958 RepID=UPI001E5C15FA|nr:hypothetical protein [Paenibacillus nasutitermitis]
MDPKKTYTCKVLIIKENVIETVVMEGQQFNYHYVQPLRNQLLLVGTTSTYYGKDKYDLNAKVCDYNGSTIREFLLGDGIQSAAMAGTSQSVSRVLSPGMSMAINDMRTKRHILPIVMQ